VSLSVYPTYSGFHDGSRTVFLGHGSLHTDKTTADLSQSSRIKYVLSAPNIASVQAQGIVTTVAPGSAKITITYDDLTIEIPVRVRKGRGDQECAWRYDKG
jgi:hypothetical protein